MSALDYFPLASVSSLDRFDSNAGRLDLNLLYDDFFRIQVLVHPDVFIYTTYYLDEFLEKRVRLDGMTAELLYHWAKAFLNKLCVASYGGHLPVDHDGVSLRPGSLEELGLSLPPLFDLFRRYDAVGYPFFEYLSEKDYTEQMNRLRSAVRDTREWLLNATHRDLLFGGIGGWVFRLYLAARPHYVQAQAPLEEGTRASVPDGRGHQPSIPTRPDSPFFPSERIDPRPSKLPTNGHVEALACSHVNANSISEIEYLEDDYRSNSEYSPTRPLFDRPGETTPCIPESSNVAVALEAVSERLHLPHSPSAQRENSCRALISHPIYGPNAKNALVPYLRPPTPFIGLHPSNYTVPCNTPLPSALPRVDESVYHTAEEGSEEGGMEASQTAYAPASVYVIDLTSEDD